MLSFTCDYAEGAHPLILKALTDSNLEQLPGYGSDVYCQRAKEKIRQACACPDADIHFLVGGTQTNATVIASLLRNYEGVVAAKTGHIGVHEAGAVEYTGHKVLPVPEHQGKIDPEELRSYLATFFSDANHEHMVFPGMVYISFPTEYGTIYSRAELSAIHGICREYRIPGFFHTVQPAANDAVPIYKDNSRAVSLLRTEHFGEVIQVEVGALLVGRIVNRELKAFRRAEEKGLFEFGGSTIVMVLKKDAASILPEFLQASAEKTEREVHFGTVIGSAKNLN